jgi:hypothetical protein
MANTTLSGNLASCTIIDANLTPAQVNTITAPAQTFTVPGLKVGDAVFVTPPGQTAGVTIGSARVSAADTLSIQFVNPTGGGLTPTAGIHKVAVFRHEGVTGATRMIT